MKVDVSEDSFEALLAYDDLFLDYFNVFLQLPAFPQPFHYNRLTGTFHEVEEHPGSPKGDTTQSAALYAPGDDERERLLEWAKTERLPLFTRTKLFLEYKLCKLLSRPLDDRSNTSRSSSHGLRGYSRQTVSYTTTSTSVGHSRATSTIGSWQSEAERAGLFKYLRPGSRCVSLPPMFGLANSPSMSVYDPLVQSININTNHSTTTGGAGQGFPSLACPGGVHPTTAADCEEPGPSETNLEDSSEKPDDSPTSSTQESTTKVVRPSHVGVFNKDSLQFNNNHRAPLGNSVLLGDDIEALIDSRLSITVDTRSVIEESGNPDPDSGEANQDLYGSDAEDGGQSIVGYEDERCVDDESTESQLRQMEGKHQLSLQQLKEHLLGSMVGFEAFKEFLGDTVGEDMLNFWLDCELYRDNMLALGDQTMDIARTNLFRTIQDKYRFKLTPDALQQIEIAQGNTGLSESVFTRTQYDVLRRLRSYWVPRFIIHQECTGGISFQQLKEHFAIKDGSSSPRDGFLPTISIVRSLPVRPNSCIRLDTNRKEWKTLVSGDRPTAPPHVHPAQILDAGPSVPRPLSARFHVSLACDKEAGRPFQRYLEGQEDSQLLANLLFWQDVSEYGLAETRSCDRLLRVSQAWSIFSKYLMDGSVWYIGLPPGERDSIHSTLLMTSDFVEAATFERAQNQSMKLLQREWLHFLKEDLKTFLRFRNRPEDRILSSRRSSASGAGDTTGHVETEGMASEDVVARRKAAKARKRKQAAMQRKLMKQVRARQLANKKRGQEVTDQSDGDVKGQRARQQDQSSADGSSAGDKEEQPANKITFRRMFQNKSLMNVFKNHLQDFEGKELSLAYQMYTDVDLALKIPEGQTDKRANQFKQIVSTYFDPSSRKSINLSHDVLLKLAREGNKPTVKVMEAAHRHAASILDTAFQSFWNSHVESMEEQGITGDALLTGPVDVNFRSESTRSLIAAYKKRRRGRAPLSGQQMPNVQDKNEFQAILAKAGKGIPPAKLMAFHRYLIEYGEKERMPLLDKDLLFYLEAQRFKEAFISGMDISLLKRKVEVIMDCFIESPLANGGVMVDVPQDVISKVNKTVDNFFKDKARDPLTIFDDSQHAIFKEMIPYWAAFTRRYREPDEPAQRVPSTKRDRRAKEKLRKFVEMKDPPKDFTLPTVSPAGQTRAGATGMSFSLSDGLKWKQTYDPGDLPSDDDISPARSVVDSRHTPVILRAGKLQTRGNTQDIASRAGRTLGKMGTVLEG